ncbi:unnamed protein product, partial [Ectocarpus sp. 13 AM-2016]
VGDNTSGFEFISCPPTAFCVVTSFVFLRTCRLLRSQVDPPQVGHRHPRYPFVRHSTHHAKYDSLTYINIRLGIVNPKHIRPGQVFFPLGFRFCMTVRCVCWCCCG